MAPGRSSADADASTTIASAAQSQLPYEERGSGEPVLLVPGTAFGPASWAQFGDRLAARRRVIAYERRGFISAAPEEAEDMRVHAEDARSILDRAGALPADVVGWSGGGLAALALAVEHRAAVGSLLLIEPSVHGIRAITASAILMTLRAQIANLRGGQRAANDLAYRWTFTYRDLDPNAWDQMPAQWREGVLDHAEAVAAEQSHEVTTRYPSNDQLRGLDLHVMIVIGERSQPYFHRIAPAPRATSAKRASPHHPTGAVLTLAGTLPPAILAGLLGISESNAAHWARLAAGDWAHYAAHR